MKGISRIDFGVLILRLGLGLTMVFFGAQKMFALFGGAGYNPTDKFLHTQVGAPTPLAHLAIFAEFLGGLGVIFGALTPLACLGVACTMGVATFFNVHDPSVLSGIFNGAQGADPSKLFFPGSLCLAAIALLILGPGKISLDAKLFKKKGPKK